MSLINPDHLTVFFRQMPPEAYPCIEQSISIFFQAEFFEIPLATVPESAYGSSSIFSFSDKNLTGPRSKSVQEEIVQQNRWY
jgi:hypothetical protein